MIYKSIPMIGGRQVKPKIKSTKIMAVFVLGIFLSGCTSFSGIRTPKYNGEPFVADKEKIAAYQNSREVIGEEKEFYLQEPFSKDITNPSLDFIDHEPVLLEEGTYVVGEDLPAGRVNLYGQAYDPNWTVIEDPNAPPQYPEVPTYSVGTLTIRDQEDILYFKNLFHMMYGNLTAQVDFIEGHIIEITGVEPAFVAFYDEEIPTPPYPFDPRYEDISEDETELEDMYEGVPIFVQEELTQPITIREEDGKVEMIGGIFEAGVHFEPGTYTLDETNAMHHTEIFLFREGEEPRVLEVAEFFPTGMIGMESSGNEIESEIELQAGDKIYPSYMRGLLLIRVSDF